MNNMENAGETTNNPKWEPMRLTHIKPMIGNREVALAARQDLWHKFIIYNVEKYETVDVLKAIINACAPDILLPVKYRNEQPNKSTFLAKCSASVIEKLVKQGLCVVLFGGHEIKIDIILGYLGSQSIQINPNRSIAQVLHYRYEPIKKVLNLDEFESERSLGSIFCPISLPRVLQFVLRCIRTGMLGNNRESRLSIRELTLKHNKITSFMLPEKFFNYHLAKLDLRHNQISDIECLRYFTEFKIIELWLDGNPLCTKYHTSQDYIQAVKNVFPFLQKLDGVVIGIEQKFVPSIQSNYLGNGSKTSLLKQFVRHFFTLYDQDDRYLMNGLYDRDALYSITLGPISNYTHKQITKSFAANRNLLKFVDYAKCQEFLLQGPEKIIATLRRQPATIHNFKTFYVDLLHEGESYMAISVQGSFMYRDVSCPPMLFNRTFVVTKKEDHEYCITNDLYYISGAPVNGTATVNPEPRVDVKSVPKYSPTILSCSEKDQLLLFLEELTTMNIKFCNDFLEEANWDIRKAITTFMKMYTVNDIPPEAFQ